MKQKLLPLLLGVLSALIGQAQDFEYTYEGQTITYTVIDANAKTCRTKCGYRELSELGHGDYNYYPGNDVKGNLVLPQNPKNGNEEFTLTTIGQYSFYDNKQMTSVVIPNTVTEVELEAFKNCSRLEKSSYPNTLVNPFGKNGVAIDYNPEESIVENGWVWGPNKSSIIFAPMSIGGEYIIPTYVSSIGEHSFVGCKNMTSVKIMSDTPILMDETSFDGLYGDVKLSIPDGMVNEYLSTNWGLFKHIHFNSGKELGYFSDGVLEYRLNPKEMTATIVGAKNYSQLQIPERFTDDTDTSNPIRYYIKGIEYKAFDGKEVNSLEFNSRSQMEYIAGYAFSGTNISSISLPETMKYIGDGAFRGSKLSKIELKSGILSIGDYAFSQTILRSTSIPETVVSIGNYAFYKTQIEDIELNTGLVSIGAYAFAETALTSISIPETVIAIENNTFENSRLKNVELKEGIVSIGSFAFRGTPISSIAIPKTVKTIESYAFFDTKNLSKIELQEGLISIGMSAFDARSNRSVAGNPIYMPTTVKTIGTDAFHYFNCSQVDISDLPAWCHIDFDSTNANPLARCGCLYLNGVELSAIRIPEGIEKIKPSSFVNCNSLKELTLPTSLHSIEDSGFSNCSNLSSIIFSEGLLSIESRAFYDCSNLTSLEFPKGLQEIGINCFSYCSNLISIKFSEGLKRINSGCFSNCDKLSTVVLPESLETIGARSFWDCYKIFGLTIPSGVSEIGPEAFLVTSVKFKDGSHPIKIADTSFYRGISDLYWGRPLENLTISLNDFSSLELGDAITEIPDGRFKGFSIKSLVIGNGVKIIGNQAFSGCSKLASLKLGSGLKSLGDESFNGCGQLGEIVLSPALETIGTSAFAGNSKLKSIIMGHSVKTIGEKAFDGCPANTISITAQTPPTTPNNAFSDYSGKLYLQGEKAKDAYYDAFTCWDRFDSYVIIEPTSIEIEYDKPISGKPRDTFQLKATLMPEDVTLPQIFWSSTNPEVATVNHEGLLTLHSEVGDNELTGRGCKIIAESLYSNSPIAELIVSEGGIILVSDIHLSQDELKMIVGNSTILSASIEPEDATDSSVIWTSSDNSIVTVNDKGEVFAVGVGDAVIKVTAADGSGIEASCIVHVLALGDSNGNGELNIADAVNTANYAVGNDVTNFVFETADINADGEITLADASGTITILLSQATTINEYRRAPSPITAETYERDVLVLATSDTADSKLDIRLRASTDYVALQTDIVLPEECTLNSITSGPCASRHSLMMKQLGENVYRVVLFDLGNRQFDAGDKALFTIHLSSESQYTSDILLDNIVAADKAGNEYRLGSFADSAQASVEAADIEESLVTVTDGRIAVTGEAGIYVTVYSLAGNVIDRFIIDGKTHYLEVEAGIYIVSIGNKSVKVVVK